MTAFTNVGRLGFEVGIDVMQKFAPYEEKGLG